MSKSTTQITKPRPDFPLFPHSGYWTKKVRQKLRYFGKVADDPEGEKALLAWLDQKDELLAGREPSAHLDGMTVRELCDRFLINREGKIESKELHLRSFQDYLKTCKRMTAFFGRGQVVNDLAPTDFERFRRYLAKGWSPVTLGNEIQRVRVVFNYGKDNLGLDAPRYGSEFTKPSKRRLRTDRAAKGKRMFEADQLRGIIAKAGIQMRAMIMLAINCGMGNTDMANLRRAHLDLDSGWIDYPRDKTGIPRRCPLWPETVTALRAALAKRPAPKDSANDDLVFITKYGKKWAAALIVAADPEKGIKERNYSSDPVTQEFSKILRALGLKRKGLAFYALRHTFQTVAAKSRDKDAVRSIMGHVNNSMDAVYDEEPIDDARLKAVVKYVQKWLALPKN